MSDASDPRHWNSRVGTGRVDLIGRMEPITPPPVSPAVIVTFERGKLTTPPGRFRIACVPGREPIVEVEILDTDALGVQALRAGLRWVVPRRS